MDKVFEKAVDLHVVYKKAYVKANDPYAYTDSGTTTKISSVDLQDAFRKGLVVISGTTEFHPISCDITAGVCTVTYVKTDGTTATTAVLATIKSQEYTNP